MDRTLGGDKHFIDIDAEFTNPDAWTAGKTYAVGDPLSLTTKYTKQR